MLLVGILGRSHLNRCETTLITHEIALIFHYVVDIIEHTHALVSVQTFRNTHFF